MDKRRKILIVEDDNLYRESLVDTLEQEGFRVEACKNVAEASNAIATLGFDLALVDIMLNGPKDVTNRDGLRVLSALKEVSEGTRVLALSAQRSDMSLVRNILKDFQADDYLVKQELNRAMMLEKVRSEIEARPAQRQTVRWESLVRTLSPEGEEVEFVQAIMRSTGIKGGQKVLQDSLFDATKWLVPLIPLASGADRGASTGIPGFSVGPFWSKGQGRAVEIVIQGKGDKDAESTPSPFALSELYRRARGGVTSIVLARPDLERSSFAGS